MAQGYKRDFDVLTGEPSFAAFAIQQHQIESVAKPRITAESLIAPASPPCGPVVRAIQRWRKNDPSIARQVNDFLADPLVL